MSWICILKSLIFASASAIAPIIPAKSSSKSSLWTETYSLPIWKYWLAITFSSSEIIEFSLEVSASSLALAMVFWLTSVTVLLNLSKKAMFSLSLNVILRVLSLKLFVAVVAHKNDNSQTRGIMVLHPARTEGTVQRTIWKKVPLFTEIVVLVSFR